MGNFLKGIKESISKKFEAPTMKITMFGPRGVGKTTVLTSTFKESMSGVAGSQIYMRSGNSESGKLGDYADALAHAIEEENASILPASNTENDFLFELGILGKNPTVKLQIQDFPGEYLKPDANEYQKDQLKRFVLESDVIMVAVDSVFLMEEGGRYNDAVNNPERVKEYMRHNEEEFRNKLVLFVPLKSEIYFHTGRIGEVAARVKETYGDLRKYFIDNNIASAIVPIMSLGGMELDHIADDPKGLAPKIATYRIYEKKPKYEPLFCAQPVFYLLTYVAARYEWMKRKGNIIDMMKNLMMSYLTNDSKFMTEIQKMRSNIITDTLGFESVTSNSIFKL